MASSFPFPGINVLTEADIIDNIVRKQRGQEYHHKIYEEVDSDEFE